MNLDAVQLFRIADELSKHLYMKGARKLRVSHDFGTERSFCALLAPDLVLAEPDLEEIRAIFAGPIQPEIASYYGTLAGFCRDDSGTELPLLGTMAELEELLSAEGAGTRIVVSRREQEFYRRLAEPKPRRPWRLR